MRLADGQTDIKGTRESSGERIRFAREARSDEAKKESGNYPIPDKGHAISAKRLSSQQRKAGNLSADEFERINRKADKVLDAGPGE